MRKKEDPSSARFGQPRKEERESQVRLGKKKREERQEKESQIQTSK